MAALYNSISTFAFSFRAFFFLFHLNFFAIPYELSFLAISIQALFGVFLFSTSLTASLAAQLFLVLLLRNLFNGIV
jgi:hypothetical protein